VKEQVRFMMERIGAYKILFGNVGAGDNFVDLGIKY